MGVQEKKNNIEPNKDVLNDLFESYLKPFHSKNARIIFSILCDNYENSSITTYDIEKKIMDYNLILNKKEINGWLKTLKESKLIEKKEERGKPAINDYKGRYIFDLYYPTDVGLKIKQRLPMLIFDDVDHQRSRSKICLPKLRDISLEFMEQLENLYFNTKILVTLLNSGGYLDYKELRKKLCIENEKLAVYSWHHTEYSDEPLFEIDIKPPSIKSKVFRLFGMVSDKDLIFKLTETGKKIAENIK